MTNRQPTTTPALADLRLRAYAGEQDIPPIVEIVNAENEADGLPERTTLASRQADYGHASEMFDPPRDITIAALDSRAVAVAQREWVDVHHAHQREYRSDGQVHPDYRRRGIGRALLAHNEGLLRDLAATHSTDRAKVFGAFTADQQAGARALLAGAGYREVRWFFDMIRPTLEDIPDVPLPAGLQIRPITPDLHRRVWDADMEAFEDHWGGHDDSPESMQRFLDNPDTDPSLWVVAFDGDEIAGGILNGIYRSENAALGVQRGWLDSVFTRRPWRRQGLARALIARSLAVLREQGMAEAMLGVDADNPTGALGLYESVGFAPRARYSAWHKPMEELQ